MNDNSLQSSPLAPFSEVLGDGAPSGELQVPYYLGFSLFLSLFWKVMKNNMRTSQSHPSNIVSNTRIIASTHVLGLFEEKQNCSI